MLEIKAKYGTARIMLDSWEHVEEEVVAQLYSMLNHPKFNSNEIVIMPDTHSGKGSVIGFTMPVTDAIIPNVVGVDLSCGMLVVELDTCPNLEELDKFINNNIPAGHNIHDRPLRYIKDYIGQGYDEFHDEIINLSTRVGQRVRPLESLGTLGGGNHFCELDYSVKHNRYYLVIHSGSRNLGARVCDYYQERAVELSKSEDGAMLCSKELAYIPSDSTSYDKYLYDAGIICNRYAAYNRELMACSIMRDFLGIKGWRLNYKNGFHCVHNYIGSMSPGPGLIIRKGAISAAQDEQVIIPLNMRDGCILGIGKGNPEWNQSAPHGAGRLMSRSKAKKELNMDNFRKSMEGIYTTSVNEGTLDESPMAYKDPEMIKSMISGTVEITDIIKPVYNFKAPEKKR